MKGQFAEHLMHTGFVSSRDPKDYNSNINSGKKKKNQFLLFFFNLILWFWSQSSFFFSYLSCVTLDNEKLIKAVIVAGLYPKVATIRPSHSKKRPGWVCALWGSARFRVFLTNKPLGAAINQSSQVMSSVRIGQQLPGAERLGRKKKLSKSKALVQLRINAVIMKSPQGSCHSSGCDLCAQVWCAQQSCFLSQQGCHFILRFSPRAFDQVRAELRGFVSWMSTLVSVSWLLSAQQPRKMELVQSNRVH